MARTADGRFRTEATEKLPALLQALAAGTPINWAARGAGITRSTYYEWEARARNGDPQFVRIAEQIEEARGKFVTGSSAQLTNLGRQGDAKAITFQLERQFPKEFGRREMVEHANAEGQPFRVQVQAIPLFDPDLLTDDELDQLERLMLKARPQELPVIEAR